MCKDQNAKRLFNLLSIALSNQQQDVSLYEGMSARDWQGLMDLCAQQGVLAVCFEAFEKCTVCPPMDELMDWLGQVEYIKSHYETHLRGAKEMSKLMANVGADMLIIKGLSLANLYSTIY